jgi:hypothetical protein
MGYIDGVDPFEMSPIELSIGQSCTQVTKALEQPISTGHQEHPANVE